jgi:hypothetical protein
MPRAALAHATFAFATAAAASSFLPATTFAGHVEIGEFDAVPEGTTSDTQALMGSVLAEKVVDFAIDDFLSGKTLLAGTVQQRVIMEAEKQSITFHYLVTGAPGTDSTGELFRASAFSFGELVQTDVQYLEDDAAAGKPTRVGRTENAIDAGFEGGDGALGEGQAISFFVRTNATQFDESGFFALDALAPEPDPETGSAVRSAITQGMYRAIVLEGPVAVPLPGALYSGIIGLGAVAWLKRRLKD